MTAFMWRALFALVIIVLITQNILLWNYSSQVPDFATPISATEHKSESVPASVPLPSDDKSWKYEPLKDAENFALNRQQCNSAFPDLWYEIDRSVSVWKHNISRQITANDTSLEWRDEGAFRALIHRNQLRILETKGIFSLEGSQFPERAVAVWSQIHRALLGATAAGEKLPSIEFSVSVDDRPNTPEEDPEDTHTLWAFSRQYKNPAHDRAFLMPDFNFWSWRGVAGSFTEMRARGKDLDQYIPDKIPKAVWRGAVWTNPEVRGPLLKVTKNKSWADVFEFDWMTRDNFIPMEDFCRYAFLVHTEGRSWSGRLKYLLNCDSVTVIHEREWTAHYYSLLVPDGPNQNFVPAKRNFSDLKKKVQYYLSHQYEAQRIADNAVATFRDRYLTLAAETCYWRRLIEGWNSVAESPEIYEQVQKNVSGELKNITMLRGVAFEEIVIGRQELSLKVDEPEVEEPTADAEGGDEGGDEGEAAEGEAGEGEAGDDEGEEESG